MNIVDCGSNELKQLRGCKSSHKVMSGSFFALKGVKEKQQKQRASLRPCDATKPSEAQTDNLSTMFGSDFAIKLHI